MNWQKSYNLSDLYNINYQIIVLNSISIHPFRRNGALLLGVLIVRLHDLLVLQGLDEREICRHGIDRDLLHRLDVAAAATFIFLRLNEFVPFELVVGEKRLDVADRDRLGVPGQFLVESELVDAGKVGIDIKPSAGEGYVLGDLKPEAVLEVVGAGVAEGAILVALQQGERPVEVHQVAVQHKRRQSARLIGAVRPIGRNKGVLRLQRRHRLAPRRPDRLRKRHPPLRPERRCPKKENEYADRSRGYSMVKVHRVLTF